jgi:hypothetical protein
MCFLPPLVRSGDDVSSLPFSIVLPHLFLLSARAEECVCCHSRCASAGPYPTINSSLNAGTT